jgi:hypothetical protein
MKAPATGAINPVITSQFEIYIHNYVYLTTLYSGGRTEEPIDLIAFEMKAEEEKGSE